VSITTPDGLAAFIWEQLETDDQELPLSLLTTWFADGYQRIQTFATNWPHLEQVWTFDTVNGTASYSLATMSGSFTVQRIRSIVDNARLGGKLRPISHDDAEARWHGPNIFKSWPQFWSVWQSKVWLWPTPDAASTLTCRGYRKWKAFGEAGSSVAIDLPTELCFAVALWALKRFYTQQEDPELSQLYEQEFWNLVRAEYAAATAEDVSEPIVVAGRQPGLSNDDFMTRLGMSQL
jgi:hypothetical protein